MTSSAAVWLQAHVMAEPNNDRLEGAFGWVAAAERSWQLGKLGDSAGADMDATCSARKGCVE
jgi:hypothetical protein